MAALSESVHVEETGHPDERPDARALRQLTEALDSPDPDQNAARKKLLEAFDILRIDKGAMGITFVGRNKRTKKILRFKAPLDPPFLLIKKPFAHEAQLAQRMGELGLGPKSEWDPATQLLAMEEIKGMTLEQFRKQVLSKMPAGERDAWMEKFARQLAHNVNEMHRHGIVHLDSKPENILIPTATAQDGKLLFIDFGVSLEQKELAGIPHELGDLPYPGTLFYQGSSAHRGKPGFPDDFESVKVILDNLLPTSVEPLGKKRAERAFLKERPALRATLLLLEEPVEAELKDPQSSASTARLLDIALKKDPSAEELREFWAEYHQRLAKRSAGQRLRILFGDPALHADKAFMKHWSDAQLKKLIDEGAKENGWQFDYPEYNQSHPDGDENLARLHHIRIFDPVDFEALRRLRDRLGK